MSRGTLTRRRILYVDDERENLIAFEQRFRERYAVHTATSAVEGLSTLESHHIDVVLSDQRMPGITGVEFLATVAGRYPGTIRCVISGFGDMDAIVEAIDRGHVYYYFHKPWDACEIESVIDAIDDEVRGTGQLANIEAQLAAAREAARHNARLEAHVAARTAELERVNRALRESEAVFRSITTAAQSAIVMIDDRGLITLWNPAAERVFGYRSEEVIGRDVADVIIPEAQRGHHHAGFRDFQRTGEGAFIGGLAELVAVGKGGREIPIEMSLSAVDIDGRLSAVGIINDITTRQRDKRELIDARVAAERANRAKSVFLANMSHEIRTPINAILGFSQLLHRESLSSEVADKVAAIERAGGHLLDLINEILEVAKIEAGQVELHAATFDLRSLLDDLEQMHRSRVEARGLRFAVDIAAEVPRFVRTDPGRVRQILVNLLSNAVKFTPHGQIALRAQRPQPGWLRFEIEDTGPGLPAADHERVFQKFVQTRSAANKGGTGLGLPISREYARLLGGDLLLSSDGSTGCLFAAEIPFESGDHSDIEDELPQDRVVALATDQATVSVLVVDDDADSRAILSGVLSAVGFVVTEAGDGEEAVALAEQLHPDVVLMDLRMPKMDGYEATRIIKARDPQTRVVAVSASVFGEHRAAAAAAGAEGFILKPFKEHQIFAAIRDVVGAQYVLEDPLRKSSPREIIASVPELVGLTPEQRAAMLTATINGDLDILLELIDGIDGSAELRESLRQLANSFEYETLLQLVGGEL